MVSYVVDEGDRLSYIQHLHLIYAEMTPKELHTRGVENLTALSRRSLRIQPFGAAFAVFLDGNFEASLILIDGLWTKGIRHLVKTGFAVALPARDMLAFCDAGSAEGITQLRKVVSRVAGGDHLLSSSLYRRCGSKWLALVP